MQAEILKEKRMYTCVMCFHYYFLSSLKFILNLMLQRFTSKFSIFLELKRVKTHILYFCNFHFYLLPKALHEKKRKIMLVSIFNSMTNFESFFFWRISKLIINLDFFRRPHGCKTKKSL